MQRGSCLTCLRRPRALLPPRGPGLSSLTAQLAQGADSLLTWPASFPDLTGNSRRSPDLAESAPGMLCGHPASRKLPGGQCVHVSTACLRGSPGPVVAIGEAAAQQHRHSPSGRAGGRQPWRGGEADGTHWTANLLLWRASTKRMRQTAQRLSAPHSYVFMGCRALPAPATRSTPRPPRACV